jgi:hypothetical protein
MFIDSRRRLQDRPQQHRYGVADFAVCVVVVSGVGVALLVVARTLLFSLCVCARVCACVCVCVCVFSVCLPIVLSQSHLPPHLSHE